MRKIVNIVLAILLLVVNLPNHLYHNILEAVGGCLAMFIVGLFFGVLLTGAFQFIHNIIRPEKKIRLENSDRISAGFLCAILCSILLQIMK
jgi:hypothetical protein